MTRRFLLITGLFLVLLALAAAGFFLRCDSEWCFATAWQRVHATDTFDECVSRGFIVQESYPRRCTLPDGRTFTEQTKAVYENPLFGIALSHPVSWQPDASQQIEASQVTTRVAGAHGYFQVSALPGEGQGIEDVAQQYARHKLLPFGSDPAVTATTIAGREARIIMPSADQPRETKGMGAVLVRYPASIVLSGSPYAFFLLEGDTANLESVARSLRFLDGSAASAQSAASSQPASSAASRAFSSADAAAESTVQGIVARTDIRGGQFIISTGQSEPPADQLAVRFGDGIEFLDENGQKVAPEYLLQAFEVRVRGRGEEGGFRAASVQVRTAPPIIVLQPGRDASIASPVRVRGFARIEGGTMFLRLRDASDKILLEREVSVTPGKSWHEPFEAELPFDARAAGGGTLEAFAKSPVNGSQINTVTVPVFFGQK